MLHVQTACISSSCPAYDSIIIVGLMVLFISLLFIPCKNIPETRLYFCHVGNVCKTLSSGRVKLISTQERSFV